MTFKRNPFCGEELLFRFLLFGYLLFGLLLGFLERGRVVKREATSGESRGELRKMDPLWGWMEKRLSYEALV